MIKKRYLLSIILFVFSIQLIPQDQRIDSIKTLIKSSKGEEKLELMTKLSNLYIAYDDKFEANEKLRVEALKQKNMKYLAYSYAIRSSIFVSNGNIDSTIYYANLANETYDKYDIVNPNKTYKFIAEAYIYSGYYELALHNLEKYMEKAKSFDAYMLLLEIYYLTERYDLAKETAAQAIDKLPIRDEYPFPYTDYLVYDMLSLCYLRTKEYDEAMKYCLKMQDALGDDIYANKLSIYYQYHLYVNYAYIYIGKGDAPKAKIYLDKISQMPSNEFRPTIDIELNTVLGEYYLLLKDYRNALFHINKVLKGLKDEVPHFYMYFYMYTVAVDLKVKALEGLDRYEEAFRLQKELSTTQDSIYRINMPLQVMKLSTGYENKQHELKKEKNLVELSRSRMINIGLIILTILSLTFLYIVIENRRRHKEKNLVLLKKYEEIEKYISTVKTRLSETTDDSGSIVHGDLFKNIEKYLKEEKAYTCSDLTRESVAKELNTNRRYVAEAIKEATGKTFTDYVNQYRLDHARRQLLSDDTASIDSIIVESGFSSIATFYRLFKAEFGMTPNEFRKAKMMNSKASANIK